MVLWTKNIENDIFFEKKKFFQDLRNMFRGGFGVAESVFEGPGAPKSILGVGGGREGGADNLMVLAPPPPRGSGVI